MVFVLLELFMIVTSFVCVCVYVLASEKRGHTTFIGRNKYKNYYQQISSF